MTKPTPTLVKEGLAFTLDRIEGYFSSVVILEALQLGLFEAFERSQKIDTVAKRLALNEGTLAGLVDFLVAEGVFELSGAEVALSPLGKKVKGTAGWYELLVGGYSPTMSNLSEILRVGKRGSRPNERLIRKGSGEIDQADIVPTFARLIGRHHPSPRAITDLGCGSGVLLTELCQEFDAQGIGVSHDQIGVLDAKKTVENAGCLDRIRILEGDVFAYSQRPGPAIFTCAFVLQEIAYQRGVEGLGSFLSRLRREHPESWLLVAEVPDQGPGTTLGAYYRCYRLIHQLSEQLLLPENEWIELFEKAGYILLERSVVGGVADPFCVEACYVLAPRACKNERIE